MDSLIKEIETLRKRLAAAQARIKELQKALEYVAPMYNDVDAVQEALATPDDSSALDAALKAEREKMQVVFDDEMRVVLGG